MSSIDHAEIARFSSHAQDWWNPQGALQPLHKLNPIRLAYIRDTLCGHFKVPLQSSKTFSGLSILDIGCGGGLLCEPLARLGAAVTGLDASPEAIKVARAHALESGSGLKIEYRHSSAEAFARGKKKFDVITVLEILEHVADVGLLLESATQLLKPNGILILSTLNRTPKSYLLGIIMAEHILKWVPRGTHDWRKFIKPSELAKVLDRVGLQISDISGLSYDPFNDSFCLHSRDVEVNYLMSAVKR